MEQQGFGAHLRKFQADAGKKDFSGEDFQEIYFCEEISLGHSYLNGVHVEKCVFHNVDIRNTEAAEAIFDNCELNNVDMSGSDLVGSKFNNVHFTDCNFSGGEWRDSLFSNCSFERCNFYHTTVNSCVFDDCSFCKESSLHFEQLCINYNTFVQCIIQHQIENEVVLSRNFALPGRQQTQALSPSQSQLMLENICLASSRGDYNVENIISAIEGELFSVNKRRMRKLRMEFISNIISQMSRHDLISPSSLVYIEMIFTEFARSALNDGDLRVCISAVMAIRNSIFESTNYSESIPYEFARCAALEVTYPYDDISIEDANNLGSLLTSSINKEGVNISVENIRKGSVIISYLIDGVVTFSAILTAVNFALAQAAKTINHINDIKNELIAVKETPRADRRAQQITNKLPAIERNGGLANEMETARHAVYRIGKGVSRLDRKVKVRFDLDR